MTRLDCELIRRTQQPESAHYRQRRTLRLGGRKLALGQAENGVLGLNIDLQCHLVLCTDYFTCVLFAVLGQSFFQTSSASSTTMRWTTLARQT